MSNSAEASKTRPQATVKEKESGSGSGSGWFTVPAPLARLFRKFPLLTYPPNELPARSSGLRDVPTLYVFISDEDALKGLPSFNPSCLKWQTFLKLMGVDFRVRPSNNHASPTGALPFLLPPSVPTDSTKSRAPIPSKKLEQYGLDWGKAKPPKDPGPKLEVYESLLDHRIRTAWLYTLYLSPANTALLTSLYVEPATSSWPVRTTILYQLRRAAELEILRSTARSAVDPNALYRGAREAFGALEALLDEDQWFFGGEVPGLFDAAVFSYTYLLLHEGLAWENRRLGDILGEFPGLVEHRDRIYQRCWGSGK
ncbi:putative mitochondrial outer membrane protein [Poronia punctata]|nr:putative mitochondrial outer membrane protein [Poronia punctata]